MDSHRGEPWFSDGNLVLVTPDKTAFKVHRGILARHSEVFQSMFEVPPPESLPASEVLENCPIVPMYDSSSELSNLIKALYDGANFDEHRDVDAFFYVASLMRLCTKYFISHLRLQAIRELTNTWSSTLAGHDAMLDLALTAPIIGDRTYPYVHPLHVLNLARETHIQIIIPSALYFLSIYPLAEILRADHPKLVDSHPSAPASKFTSTEDLELYTLMFQHRISTILNFVRKFCGQRITSPKCLFPDTGACNRGLSRLSSRMSRSWVEKTGPLHFISQSIQEVKSDRSICETCRQAFREDASVLRETIWKGLPAAVGLPSWEELEKAELE